MKERNLTLSGCNGDSANDARCDQAGWIMGSADSGDQGVCSLDGTPRQVDENYVMAGLCVRRQSAT